MKTYNLKESLIQMDKDTDFKYTLTDLYEACQLDEKKKAKLAQYIDAKDPVGMNAMLCNESGIMTENVSDDIPDEEMPEGLVTERWTPDLTDCPECGDISFDSKKGRCTKCSYRESLEEALTKGDELTIWWKDPSWDENAPCYARVGFVGTTKDGKMKFTSLTYGDQFLVDAQAGTVTTPNGKTFDLDNSSGWMKRLTQSINESFQEGDMVWVKPSNKPGRVVSVRGEQIEVEIMGGADPDRRDVFYPEDLEMEQSLNESDEELDFSCYNLTNDQIEKVKYIRQHLDTIEGYKAYYELEKEITDEGGCMDIFYDLSADFAWDNRFSVAITKLALADGRPDLADPEYLPGGAYAEYMEDPKYADVLLEDINGQNLEATLRAAAETKLAEMGYEGDFIDEYFGIKLTDTDDNRVKVTVWGELSYEESSELADVLNHIVAEEDPDAYFDHETSGRMAAYIRKDQSEDIPDEALVSEWSEKFNSCTTWEQLKAVYGEFYNIRDDLNNGTHRALYDIIDKKIDELKPVEESLTEALDSDIPAPYNKYYEIGINREDIPEEDIPDAFDNYKGMNLLAIVYAKEQYEDALGDNCLDYCYLVEDDQGKMIVTTAGPRVYAVELNEIERCIGDNIEEALTEDAEEAPAAIYSMLDAADKYVDNDEYPEGASEEEIIEIAKNNPDCMKVTKWVDGQTGPDEVVWERPVDTWFICQYEGGAEYEHAEGGYYYETLTLLDKETFPSKEAARKRLAELADEARKEGQDVVAQNDDFFRIKTGKYIGDCEEYHVEAKEGAHASGKQVYEGLNESILREMDSPEEKPYSAAEIESEIRSLTLNFTKKKDNLMCGFKEENDVAVKLLKKHYKNVKSEKNGAWFEIDYSDPIKNLKENAQNTPVKLASEYFYDTIKNIQDAGWSDVLSFAEDSGWISGSNIIIPAGTVMTLVDDKGYFNVYLVKTTAGDEFIPFNKDFIAESPLSFEDPATEGANAYNVTFYMDSLDDNVMSGPHTTQKIYANSEEEAKKKLIDSSTDKYYIPTIVKIEQVNEAIEMTADEMKAKHGTDNPDIINAGKPEEERVVLKEDLRDIDNKVFDLLRSTSIGHYIDNYTDFWSNKSGQRFVSTAVSDSFDTMDYRWARKELIPLGVLNLSWDPSDHSLTLDISKFYRDAVDADKLEEERVALKEQMTYIDTHGFLGEPGEKYTMSQFRRIWQDKDSDPIMSSYDTFEEWVGETISQMDAHDDTPAPEHVWIDVDGVMGTPGEEWTSDNLIDFWYAYNESDPILAHYNGDWKKWIDDTVLHLKKKDIDEGFVNENEGLNEGYWGRRLKEPDVVSHGFRIRCSGLISHARRQWHDKRAYTVTFGGYDKNLDGLRVTMTSTSGVTRSSEVTFLTEDDAKTFADKMGLENYSISNTAKEYELYKVQTEYGPAYVTHYYLDSRTGSIPFTLLSNPNYGKYDKDYLKFVELFLNFKDARKCLNITEDDLMDLENLKREYTKLKRKKSESELRVEFEPRVREIINRAMMSEGLESKTFTSKEWEHKDKDGKIGRIRQSDGKGDRKPLTRDQAKDIAKFRGHEDDELYPVNESKNELDKLNTILSAQGAELRRLKKDGAAQSEIDKIIKDLEDTKKKIAALCEDSINESVHLNEDLSSITALADDCGKNTFKQSARDVRFTFEDEKSASNFMNKLKEKNIHYDELSMGVIKVSKASALNESDESDEDIDIEYIKQTAKEYDYIGDIDAEIAELGDDPDTLDRMYSDIMDVGMVVNQKQLGKWRFLLLSETDFDEPVIETDKGYYVVCARGSIALVPIEKEEIFGLDESLHESSEGHRTFADMLNDPETQRANAEYHKKMQAKFKVEDALAKEAKSWPDDKELTYEEALALAKAYYTQGGDSFYETTEKYQFDDEVELFGPMTVGQMKRDFGVYDSVARDRMAEDVQLTEAADKYELLIEPYERYNQCPLVKKTFNTNSLARVLEYIADTWMYGFDPIERAADEGWECETKEEAREALQKELDMPYTQIVIDALKETNGDGCGFIYYLKNLTTGELIIDSGIEPEEEEEDLFEAAEVETSDDYTLSIWNDDELVKDNVWSVSDALEFIHDNGGNIIKVIDHEGERIIWKDGKAVGGGFIGKDIDEYGVTSYFDDGEDVPTHKGPKPFNAWEWMYGEHLSESFKKGDKVELYNGQTGTVTRDFDWESQDLVEVEIDGMDEIKRIRSDALRSLPTRNFEEE